MRSAIGIPIEPMHSFSHGRCHQRNIAHGRICSMTTKKIAQHGAHTGQPMQCSLQFAAFNMKSGIGDPFHSQMTAVKIRHLLTCIS